jgi:hypothetical protein
MGCRHAKEEMQKKTQKTPKTANGMLFPSNFATPGLFFTAGLRGESEQEKQTHLRQDSVGGLIDTDTSINGEQQGEIQSGI